MEGRKDFAAPNTSVATTQKERQQLQPSEVSPNKVSTLTSFLHSCMKLLRNQDALVELQEVIEKCEPQERSDKGRNVNRVRRTGREMRLHAQIGDYDMTDIILDLGSEVNVLTKQTWEQMGKPTLEWSPIQLRLANQQKIVPLGRFPNVPVDIDGVSTLADFEVIEIIDDSNPYPALLDIEWELDNHAVINLKNR